MGRFCKVFENEKGDQLLIRLSQSEESDNGADISIAFMMDHAIVEVTLGGLDWENSEKVLEAYNQEEALKILNHPEEFIAEMAGFYKK